MVLGATGVVGRELVRTLLGRTDLQIRVPGRRPPPVDDPRVRFSPMDFEALVEDGRDPEAFAGAAAVFVALGTTMKTAGSKDAFRRVDLEYVAAAARAARRAGVPHLLVVSSVGASARAGSFYLRVKGEMEASLRHMGFPRLTISRPSLLLGDREERRPGESVAAVVLGGLAPILIGPLGALRPIRAETVAEAMVEEALRAGEHPAPKAGDEESKTAGRPPAAPAVRVLEPVELRKLGRRPS